MFHCLLEFFSFIAFGMILCSFSFWGGCVCEAGSAGHMCYHSNCYHLQDQKSMMKTKSDFLALAVFKALRLFTVISNNFLHCLLQRLNGWPKGRPPDTVPRYFPSQSSLISFTGSSLQYRLAIELQLLKTLNIRMLIILFLALTEIPCVWGEWHQGLCA